MTHSNNEQFNISDIKKASENSLSLSSKEILEGVQERNIEIREMELQKFIDQTPNWDAEKAKFHHNKLSPRIGSNDQAIKGEWLEYKGEKIFTLKVSISEITVIRHFDCSSP